MLPPVIARVAARAISGYDWDLLKDLLVKFPALQNELSEFVTSTPFNQLCAISTHLQEKNAQSIFSILYTKKLHIHAVIPDSVLLIEGFRNIVQDLKITALIGTEFHILERLMTKIEECPNLQTIEFSGQFDTIEITQKFISYILQKNFMRNCSVSSVASSDASVTSFSVVFVKNKDTPTNVKIITTSQVPYIAIELPAVAGGYQIN